jgi:thiol-disulfide isomerase/thioredoxin/Tfp pilus assembly protein PilF
MIETVGGPAQQRLMPSQSLCRVLVLAAISSASAVAQYEGTLPAKALFDQGEKELQSDNYDAAIADFRKAIALDPNFAEAHERYIFTSRQEPYLLLREGVNGNGQKLTDADQAASARAAVNRRAHALVQEYEALAKEHPGSAIYLWALGKLYEEKNVPRQEDYCRQAIHMDSRFAPGYECLSTTAYNRGDQKEAIDYEKRVVELEPRNPEALFIYTFYLSGDPIAYKAVTDEMAREFPNSPESAQALYWYAVHQTTDAAQIEAFERMRKLFPPDKFDWSANGVTELFPLYDRTDSAKGRSLAHEMLVLFPKDKEWANYVAYADALATAEDEVDGKPATALALLESIKTPSHGFDMQRAQLLQAHALDLLNETAEAYSLLLSTYAKHPTDEIHGAIGEYAKRLGKTPHEQAAAVWSAISANSSPAIPFSLPSLLDGNIVSLASYRGHVVVVDFWYPRCGPCREAFPFLQQIAAKYKKQGLVVLAINDQEEQEDEVIPFLRSKRYDFIPLKGTQEWATKQYHVQFTPTTFIVGPDGLLYFRPRIYNRIEERTTDLEIQELLAHGG